jgi:ABC-2 type transport system ATP-binding protein
VLTHLPGVSDVEREGERVWVTGTGDLVPLVLETLERVGVEAQQVQVQVHSATLDAFVRLTGHQRSPRLPMEEVGRR